MHPSTQQRQGFTLIELLVVISILALLAAMLLPAIAGARRSANMNADAQNAKQIVTTMESYRSEFGGNMPVPGGYDTTTAVTGASDEVKLTALCFYTLASRLEIAPKVFVSPFSTDAGQVVVLPIGDPADFVSSGSTPSTAAGFDGLTWAPQGTDYALDWSTPKGAGSVRVVVASRIADNFGTSETNAVFGDSHVEKFSIGTTVRSGADGSVAGMQAYNTAVDSADNIYDVTGDDQGGKYDPTKIGRGSPRWSFVR